MKHTKKQTERGSHPIDIHVGRRLRTQRLIKGRSQTEVADAIGLTFQQLQKYEKGVNRIAPSRLQMVANFLEIDVAWFYQDGPTAGVSFTQAHQTDLITQMLSTSCGVDLAKAFVAIPDNGARRSLLHVAEAMAATQAISRAAKAA
jgi:transcriptional regulator with XRE-family HTH domain